MDANMDHSRLIYPHYKHAFDVRGYASKDIAHVWKHGCSCMIIYPNVLIF